MQSDYKLDELSDQDSDSVTYRVLTQDGTPFALTRMKMAKEEVAALSDEGRFQQALADLKSIDNAYVRRVIDGGQDEVDRFPWVASAWIEGEPLSEVELSQADLAALDEQLADLDREMGKTASCLNFEPGQIHTLRTEDGRLHFLFAIDYPCWFSAYANGQEPAMQREFGKVTSQLRASLKREAVLKKPEVLSRKVEPLNHEESIPAPRPKPTLAVPKEGVVLKLMFWLGLIAALAVIFVISHMNEVKAEPARGTIEDESESS